MTRSAARGLQKKNAGAGRKKKKKCTWAAALALFPMVQTSKTDHFFKLAPFWSPLTELIVFGMAGKLLTSATRICSPFVDTVSRI